MDDKLNIKIKFGSYKGYTGRIIGKKIKDDKKIFAKLSLRDIREFFVGQLENIDGINLEKEIQITDGSFRGFSGRYAGEYQNADNLRIIVLRDISGYKKIDKRELINSDLIVENPSQEDDEKYEVNVYTSNPHTKVFLFRKQFETNKEISERYGQIAKDNIISRNSTTEDVFIQDLKDDDEVNEAFDVDEEDVDNKDQELDAYTFANNMDKDEGDDMINIEDAEIDNEDESDKDRAFFDSLMESSYADTQRTNKTLIDRDEIENLIRTINVARKHLKMSIDVNFNSRDFVSEIYPIINYFKDKQPATYKNRSLNTSNMFIILGCLIKYYQKNVYDFKMITGEEKTFSIKVFAGLYVYIKKGYKLENLEETVDLEELGDTVEKHNDIDYSTPHELLNILKRKRNMQEDDTDNDILFSKKNKFLNLDDFINNEYISKTDQFFTLSKNYEEIQRKKENEMEEERKMLIHVDEINELRIREWKKVPLGIYEGGYDKYEWILKQPHSALSPLTLNPSDFESFNYVKKNFDKFNKWIKSDGKVVDPNIKLEGSMREQYDSLISNGIPPSKLAKKIAEEHGVDELDIIGKLNISDNNYNIDIKSPMKKFIIPFFEFINSNYGDSLDQELGVSVYSIYVKFVNFCDFTISYKLFLNFMKGLYKDNIVKDVFKGIRFKNVKINNYSKLQKRNDELKNILQYNDVPFFMYVIGDSVKDVADFFEASTRYVEDEEENPVKIFVDDLYNEYKKYIIRKNRSSTDNKNTKYQKYCEISPSIIDKDVFLAILNNTENGTSILDETESYILTKQTGGEKGYTYTDEFINEEKKRNEFLKNFVENAYNEIFRDLLDTYPNLVPDISYLYTMTYLIQINNITELASLQKLTDEDYFEYFLSYGKEINDSSFESKLTILFSNTKKLTSIRNIGETLKKFTDNWNNRNQNVISEEFCNNFETWAIGMIENKTKKKPVFDEKTEKQYYLPNYLDTISWNKNLKKNILDKVQLYLINPLNDMKKTGNSILNFRDYNGEERDIIDCDQAENIMKQKSGYSNYKNILEKMNRRNNSNNKSVVNFSQLRKDYSIDQDLWDLVMDYINNYFTNRDIDEKDFRVWEGNNMEEYSISKLSNENEIDKSEVFGWEQINTHLINFYKDYLKEEKLTFSKNLKFIDFFVMTVQNKLLNELKVGKEKQYLEFQPDEKKFIIYFIALSESIDFSFEKFFRLMASQINGVNYDDFIDFFAKLYKERDEKTIPSSDDMLNDFKNYLAKSKRIIWREKKYKESPLYINYKIVFDVIYYICENYREEKGFIINEDMNNIDNLMSSLNCLEYQIKEKLNPEFVKKLGIPLYHIRAIVNSLISNEKILESNFHLNFFENNNSKFIHMEKIDGKNNEKVLILFSTYKILERIYIDYTNDPENFDFSKIDMNISKDAIDMEKKTINPGILVSDMESLKKEIEELSKRTFHVFEISEQSIGNNKKYYINHVKNTSYGDKIDTDLSSNKWKKEYKLYDCGNFSDINNEDNIKFLYYLNICLYKNDLIFFNKELDDKYTDASRILYNLIKRVSRTDLLEDLKISDINSKDTLVFVTDVSKSKLDPLYSVRSTNRINNVIYTDTLEKAFENAKNIMDNIGYNFMQEYRVKDSDSDELKKALKVFVRYPFTIKQIIKTEGNTKRYFVYDCYSSVTKSKLLNIFSSEEDSRDYIKTVFANIGLNYPFSFDDNSDKDVTYYRTDEVIKAEYQDKDILINSEDDLSILTDSFDITGFTQGRGDEKGCIIFKCVTSIGNPFLCVPKGDLEYRRSLYEQGNRFIKPKRIKKTIDGNVQYILGNDGKELPIMDYVRSKLIVEFQGYDEYGFPRFPKGLSILE